MPQPHTDAIRSWTRWTARARIAALASWAALVNFSLGDELLARKVHLDIPAEPLARALIQFSAQSGVQVAATHEDVADVQTQGVKGGDYALEDALNLLLHNTGLSFSPVGNGTVAIRGASKLAGQSDVNVINPTPLPAGADLAGLGFVSVVLVINTSKVAGANIGAIADYLAFISLSHCDPLPSILDLMAASCSQRPAPTTLTAADAAFLKAIYSRQSPELATPYVGEIETLMQQQLAEQQ